MRKLAILTTHPIQYYAPVFKLLHERGQIEIKVFYTWETETVQKFDPGFGKDISWDIPLLEGYPYEWVQNTAADKGSHHFKGIVNPHLIQQIESWQSDAILIYGWAYQSHLKAIRYFKNRMPVFFRGDSTLLDSQSVLKKYIRTLLLRWIYSHINQAFYVGSQNKAYFKKFGLKEDQLTFASHAVDNQRFATSRKKEAQELRTGLKVLEEDILIVFAGKFEEKKDPLLLLNSFLQLKKTGLHLLFVGNGVLEETLKQEAGNDSRIHFLDFQNQQQMPVVYQACDLFCLPSKGSGETWGLAVNEAMACSKAILVSDKVGCAVDLVKDGYNGMIFKSGNTTDIKRCLDQLTNSKALLKQYGYHSSVIINDWTFLNITLAIENELNK